MRKLCSAHRGRAGGLLKHRHIAGWNYVSFYMKDQEEKFLIVCIMADYYDLAIPSLHKVKFLLNIWWNPNKVMQAKFCHQLRNSCIVLRRSCFNLQSVEMIWMSHLQWVGWVCAVGTLESEYCLEEFGGKSSGIPRQASVDFLFTGEMKDLFLCCIKWENFFCAWWVQWELLIPSLLNCAVFLCTLQEVPAFLPPVSLKSGGLLTENYLFFQSSLLTHAWQVKQTKLFFSK